MKILLSLFTTGDSASIALAVMLLGRPFYATNKWLQDNGTEYRLTYWFGMEPSKGGLVYQIDRIHIHTQDRIALPKDFVMKKEEYTTELRALGLFKPFEDE